MSGLCLRCKDELALPAEEFCKDCLGDVENDLRSIIDRDPGDETGYELSDPKHPSHHAVYTDHWDMRP